ncbi:MCE family protein [Mycolicibacterium pulveris]|uniref:Mammalian cell entry protein n=1 Tax=Mycolicibacterium pulveris TaxID=36813 RepID=A0A7I7UGA6_MYCPV|nr:MCE family protein [Mycolicibacterium pulveris]MCV6982743.1 MCE family protein [Mycolicibacterium pulveris]BBY80327.1 mammalian cell entry protein [Mycolicibacterium pulveris]
MTPRAIVKLIVVLVMVGFVCGGCVSGPLGGRALTIVGEFDSASGLYEGNAVSVLGMPVGKVEKIDPKGAYVEVTMRVDPGVQIPADAQAVTVSTSILTDRHVELTPAYRDGPTLADGTRLGLDRTRTPVEFDRVLAMIDELAVHLQGDGRGSGPVADLLSVSAAMTHGNGAKIRSALGELSTALKMSQDRGAPTADAITTIVTNLDRLTAAAVENDQTIRDVGTSVRQLSAVLAAEQLGSGSTGAQVNEILTQTADLIDDNRDHLKATAAGMETVTKAIADYRREMAEALDVAPMLLDNVYNMIDHEKDAIRAHPVLDKVELNGQMTKELCNLLGMKQLGCTTGTIQDFGPDFGLTSMLEGLAGLPG